MAMGSPTTPHPGEPGLQREPTAGGARPSTSRPRRQRSSHPPPFPNFALLTSNPRARIPTADETSNGSAEEFTARDLEWLMRHHRGPGPISEPGLPYDLQRATENFGVRLRLLWREAEDFSITFASLPDPVRDAQLRPRIMDYLVRVSDRSIASDLLGSSTTRFHLVTRAINEWLLDHVLNENMVKEFDTAAYDEFLQLKMHLIRSEVPLAARKILLDAMVKIVANMLVRPDFPDFCAQKFHWLVEKLWRYIGPLLPDTPQHQVDGRGILAGIISKAASLSVEMLCTPLEYVHCFPDVGDAFVPREMRNQSFHIRGEPGLLRDSNFEVKLGISPITFICRHTGSDWVPQLVSRGDVILRSPRSPPILLNVPAHLRFRDV
ncbi:uncharacterized protein ACLA_019560 [Aspergillus clavatus NRRL 1]|uniref:Uncharacterized protein n=1 Tax=Aspergillus clavatus (strain ATCC 1007 / CBS 513.65 / DSM 816 / NCTC 3887 / NRRL 1 / QM 1276 / 107) TaxID=344612 RepID=A1CNN0_ASPCL|nr:uncharacterized protein ACLA_019560 [Aspergillus clavatus NRRL 1]EAW07251.1 hypothetical protein ACLA_019560 [Aspergillus clavatus NRRL 1]